MASPVKKVPMNFTSIAQVDVPQGRNGKHKEIVTRILSDLDQVRPGVALKVPLAELKESKENVRSALNRASSLPEPSSSFVTRSPSNVRSATATASANRIVRRVVCASSA